PYQSALFSGLNDWTPGIDSLARENTYFTRMYAGSFATSPGLMSILVGHEFWAPVKAARSFSTAWNTDATIPRGLRQNGYYSAFLTTGNLKFSSKAKWLEHIGFDYIEGHDHHAYEGKRRRHFDAVADEYLYERALAYVEEEVNDHQPYFLALENVSTHHPYIQPVTGEKTAESVFRYMDATVVSYYEALRETGFFDNGLLILVSDHRAMVPVTTREIARFGDAAVSLVPAVVIGGDSGVKGEVSEPHHQSDILPSLLRLT